MLLRRISTRKYDRQFRREDTTKLIRHETIFNFHMNNSRRLLKHWLSKIKLLLLKMLNQTENFGVLLFRF